MDAQRYRALSPSSRRALGYAHAAALLRSRGPDADVAAEDLLVGLLLAHPDRDGEARVVLTHFGLTGRDVLPRGYPPLTGEDLRSRTRLVRPQAAPPLSPAVERSLLSLPDKEVHLLLESAAPTRQQARLAPRWAPESQGPS